MNLSPLLCDRLAKALVENLKGAEAGYCLRVDHLDSTDANCLCRKMREGITASGVETWVLSTCDRGDPLEITPERAIELRNRKQVRLALLVPAGVMDVASSSLTNSFASFDLQAFWREAAKDLLLGLPEDLQVMVRRVVSTLRGVMVPRIEQQTDYLASVIADPTPRQVGAEIWRVGLIPDFGGEGCLDRLERNLKCVRELVRPARAHTSAAERLNVCDLRDGPVKTELLAYLGNKCLRDARGWLKGLVEEQYRERITFENWTFVQGQESNLERIDVVPLLDDEGSVRQNTGFHQSEPGTQPVAPVGPKNKIKIKWECAPKTPSNLKRWKAEIIPSREYYGEEEAPAIELPQARVSTKSRQASIPLDIDLPEDASLGVQVRIVGLDEHDSELTNAEGAPIEGLSEEFWLGYIHDKDGPPPPPGRRATVSNLSMARLQTAQGFPVESIEEAPGEWTMRDLHYFSVRFNGRYTARLGLSPVLRDIEKLAVDDADGPGCYRASVEGNGTVDPATDVNSVPLPNLEASDLGKQFLDRRSKFLRKLGEQEHRGLVEVADWNSELSQRAVTCANAFAKLLDEETSPLVLREAMMVDTFRLDIELGNRVEPSVLILPTHPLRALWYTAYAELLRSWEEELLKHEKKDRSRMLDLELLGQVAPLNCPTFLPSGDTDVFLFTQNLRFFWGVALPLSVRNPARRVANVARAVALSEDEASIADLPPEKVSQELRAYYDVHRYLETLRVNVWNPGVGTFAAQVLRGFYASGEDSGADDETEDSAGPPPRLELFAHVAPPVPSVLPPLSRLQQDLYEARPRGRHHHLAPFFSIAIRPEEQTDRIPGGDVNLSLVMDRLQPAINAVANDETATSCSLFGLMVRMLPRFVSCSEGVRWEHHLRPVLESSTARHPNKLYTPALAHLHSSLLKATGRLLGRPAEDQVPAVVVDLPRDERTRLDAVHTLSDWVITLDRFFGVEFYDAPADADLAEVAQKYLLDYAPEFLDGMGHRMLVTTAHREEVEEILARAMQDLGFQQIEDSVGKVLRHLKTISGRLALRVLGDEGRAKEAVSLGVVAAYLESQGELNDAILVPVDSHPELFGPARKKRSPRDSAARCDLLRVQLRQNRLVATFIEVKSRSGFGNAEELANRIVDQIEATQKVFQEMFFQEEPRRIDQVLQRARLATILQFYLRRAVRYGLINSDDTQRKLEEAIGRLESGIAQLRVLRWGFIVNLQGQPQRTLRLRDAEIRFLTARDVVDAGFSVSSDGQGGGGPVPSPKPKGPPAPPSPPPPPAGRTLTEKTISQPPGDAPKTRDSSSSEPSAASDASSERDTGRTSISGVTAPRCCPLDTVEVELGKSLDDEAVVWRSSVRGSPHLFIVGIPGQGKSVTTTRILCELAGQGLPALVVDFHGQFGDPAARYATAARPAVLDVVKGLPFSPFEAETDQGAGTNWWRNNCFALAEIFQYVCGLGDMQRDVVFEAIKDCYLDLGFDEGTAERFPTLDEFHKRLGELEEERSIRNVIPRCRPLLEFGLFPSTKAEIGLSELLGQGLVVDVSNLGVEALQLAAGAFVLRKVYKDMFLWGETDRLRLAIVLDEAHRLARDITLPKIMKEGRKFGIAVVVASQGLSDYHPDVVGNAGTKVVFRTNFPMSKKVGGFLRAPKGVDLAEAIEQLDVGEAFVQTPEMNSCARVRMHPLA